MLKLTNISKLNFIRNVLNRSTNRPVSSWCLQVKHKPLFCLCFKLKSLPAMPCHATSMLTKLLHNKTHNSAFIPIINFLWLIRWLLWKCKHQVGFSPLARRTAVTSCALIDPQTRRSQSVYRRSYNPDTLQGLMSTSTPHSLWPHFLLLGGQRWSYLHADARGNELHMCVCL